MNWIVFSPLAAHVVRRGATSIVGAWIAVLLSACAVPQPGTAQHAQIQGAIDVLGRILGGTAFGTTATGASQVGAESGTAGGRGELVVMNMVPILVGDGKPSEPRWSGVALRESELMGIFKASPLGNCSPCYPRVAIRIKDYSESLLTFPLSLYAPGGAQPVIRPPECVKFDAKIWRSSTKSEHAKDVIVCNGLIQKSDGNWSRLQMRNFDLSVSNWQHTQEARTMGPRAPHRLLGENTKEDKAPWTNGFYLFGNLFLLTGFEGVRQIENIPDDRMWFVNLAELKR